MASASPFACILESARSRERWPARKAKGCPSGRSAKVRQRLSTRRGVAVSKRRLVDTNLIVRYLVQDHEKHAKAAGRIFDACDRGDVVLVVLPAVLAECVFVLESFYEQARADIAPALGRLISSRG